MRYNRLKRILTVVLALVASIAAFRGVWFAYNHPELMEGWSYEFLFGMLAIGALLFALDRGVDVYEAG